MIGRGDHNYIAWKLIQLGEQEGDNSLDLACLMNVTALLADCIELVEEEHARRSACILEEPR